MVKCKDCGYVCFQNNESRELEELERFHRENGRHPRRELNVHPGLQCFMRSHDLSKETSYDAGEEKSESAQTTKNLNTLNIDRTCESFYSWNQGFSPKEHRQMQFLERQEERHRKWNEEDREWRRLQEEKADAERERQSLEDKEWKIKQEVNADIRHRENIRYMGVFVTTCVCLTQVVTTLIPIVINYLSGKK